MQQNNNQKNQNKKFKASYIGVLLISILLLVGVYILISDSVSKPDELKVEDFWTYLEEDKIQTVVIKPAGGENNNNYYITGKYENESGEKKNYEILIPASVVDEKIITPNENGKLPYNVNITIKELKTFDWGVLISILVPVIMVVLLFTFIFKNANNSGFE